MIIFFIFISNIMKAKNKKNILYHTQKHISNAVKHITKHKHYYALGTFWTFAIVKTFVLIAWFFGVAWFIGNSVHAYNDPYTLCSSVTEIPTTECMALVDIYNSTDGDHWNNKTNRMNTWQICNIGWWYGVTCTGSPKHVTNLALSNNNLSWTINNIFGWLPYLNALWLNNNSMAFWNYDALWPLSNLKTLALNNNIIPGFTADAFNNLNNLETLYLSNNPFTFFNTGTFEWLPKLKNLQMSNDNLPYIPNLPNSIQILAMDNNQITNIPSTIFAWKTGLQILYLYNNNINHLSTGTFSDLISLTNLRLNNNPMTWWLANNVFDSLNSLTTLYLYNDQLTNITSSTFHWLANISDLRIQNNLISTIANDAFQWLTSLQTLMLNNNQLTSLSDNIFDNLTNLHDLYLNNNQLVTLPEDLTWLSLQSLDPTNNKICTSNMSSDLLSFVNNIYPNRGITQNISNCDDFVDVWSMSNDTDPFIIKWYQDALWTIMQDVHAGTYVWTKKIKTLHSNGRLTIPVIQQSADDYPNKIESEFPAWVLVKSNWSNFLGMLKTPTSQSINEAIHWWLSNAIFVASFGSTTTWESVNFVDQTTWDPINAIISLPAPWINNWQSVQIYYSEDGWNTRNFLSDNQVELLNGHPYVTFTTNHFTDFSVVVPWWGGWGWTPFTWSFVINNDDASTTSLNVTLDMSTTPTAANMRFSDNGSSRSTRESYSNTKVRTLPWGAWSYWTKTVYVQFDADGNTVSDAQVSDSIDYTGVSWWGSWGWTGTWSCSSPGAGYGCISLEIVANGYGYCEYGNSLDLGITWYSASMRDISSPFLTTSGTAVWYCNDLRWAAPRTLSIASSDLLNMTTNNAVHTISGSKVFIKNPIAHKTLWVCTANSWSSQGSWINIGTDTVILGKYSSTWEVCQIETSGVDLKVEIPAYQALGQYSGTLTITVPNL